MKSGSVAIVVVLTTVEYRTAHGPKRSCPRSHMLAIANAPVRRQDLRSR